jgi:hypothetical protein
MIATNAFGRTRPWQLLQLLLRDGLITVLRLRRSLTQPECCAACHQKHC